MSSRRNTRPVSCFWIVFVFVPNLPPIRLHTFFKAAKSGPYKYQAPTRNIGFLKVLQSGEAGAQKGGVVICHQGVVFTQKMRIGVNMRHRKGWSRCYGSNGATLTVNQLMRCPSKISSQRLMLKNLHAFESRQGLWHLKVEGSLDVHSLGFECLGNVAFSDLNLKCSFPSQENRR